MHFSCFDNNVPSNLNNFISLHLLVLENLAGAGLYRFQHYNSHAFAMRIQREAKKALSIIAQ